MSAPANSTLPSGRQDQGRQPVDIASLGDRLAKMSTNPILALSVRAVLSQAAAALDVCHGLLVEAEANESAKLAAKIRQEIKL